MYKPALMDGLFIIFSMLHGFFMIDIVFDKFQHFKKE